jgi:hypothetical protein
MGCTLNYKYIISITIRKIKFHYRKQLHSLFAAKVLKLFYSVFAEVDLDANRVWCPRAGCETVCDICGPVERCRPQSVRCPTCSSDFCSNCKNPWHSGFSCEENTRRLTKEGRTDLMESGIPFDSDLIKCCPMCNVPIEKDEGCAQMMCKRCKHVFCWYCLASLDVSLSLLLVRGALSPAVVTAWCIGCKSHCCCFIH